jgi:hypothetical protein
MIPKSKVILEQCIEAGIARGIRRAYKHLDNPSIDVLGHFIDQSIWEEIHTYFEFPQCNETVI